MHEIQPLIEKGILRHYTYESIEIYVNKKTKIYIPENATDDLLKAIHEEMVHPGSYRMYNTIKKFFTTPKLKNKIIYLTNNCQKCQINKPFRNYHGEIKGNISSSTPWESISTDLYGPFKLEDFHDTSNGYILTITDRFSRWSRLILIKNIKGSTIASATEKYWIKKHPHPSKILSDQGRQFTSKEYADLCKTYNIEHQFSSPFNPTGNSISERINSTISNSLRCLKGLPIKKAIAKIENSLNQSYHSTLKCSPNELLHALNKFDPLKRSIKIDLSNVQKNILTQNEKTVRINNRMRNTNFNYTIGCKVYKQKQIRSKLDAYWEGPFTVKDVKAKGNVVLIKRHNNSEEWTNIKQLRPFQGGAECRDLTRLI